MVDPLSTVPSLGSMPLVPSTLFFSWTTAFFVISQLTALGNRYRKDPYYCAGPWEAVHRQRAKGKEGQYKK